MKSKTLKVSASVVAIAAGWAIGSPALANDDVMAHVAAGDVVMPSINYFGWNYSPFDQINTSNVANLTVAWALQLGVLEQFESQPLVVGDTMFVVTPVNQADDVGMAPNVMLALDLNNNGAIKWEFRPDVDRDGALTACCGDQTRGLNYAEGKIFYNTADGQVFALDAATGEALWRSVGADVTIREHMMGNGIVIGDLYIAGNEGGESGVRGKVSAFDINTGQTQWVMYNMGPNNEVGIGPRFNPYYADDRQGSLNTWWGDSWRRGGGTVWGYFTYDPNLNEFYYSTGNCGPWNPDYRREWGVVNLDEQGGLIDYRNNWCAGQMARDATTGELIWAYGITPADMWDLDEPLITPLVDLDMNGDGVLENTAIKASRSGTFYVWDRTNGQLLNQPWHFVYVDIDHGVDVTTGRKLYDITRWAFTSLDDRRRYTDYEMEGAADRDDYTGTEINSCPGNAARNWQNDSWSPVTGLLYTSTDNSCFTQVVTEGEYVAGEGYTLRRGAGTYPGGNNRDIVTGEPTEIAGQLQANDPVAGRTVWQIEWEVNNNVPNMATAGGLIFQGGNNRGEMLAYDAATGDELWSFPVGSGFSASATSYMGPDGRQYIAIIGSGSNTGQVNFNDAANDADRYRRGGATLFVFALPQSVAGGM